MVKLAEGNDMQQLRIEVRSVPAYCMNIEECMNVEAKVNRKPWYHDIKAYIKDSEYPLGPQTMRRSSLSALRANSFLVGKSYTRGTIQEEPRDNLALIHKCSRG